MHQLDLNFLNHCNTIADSSGLALPFARILLPRAEQPYLDVSAARGTMNPIERSQKNLLAIPRIASWAQRDVPFCTVKSRTRDPRIFVLLVQP
jgi:hypothetical protein